MVAPDAVQKIDPGVVVEARGVEDDLALVVVLHAHRRERGAPSMGFLCPCTFSRTPPTSERGGRRSGSCRSSKVGGVGERKGGLQVEAGPLL